MSDNKGNFKLFVPT